MKNIGISITSAYGAASGQAGEVRDGARQMIARTKAAAIANCDSLFVGDHHIVPTPYYQNTPMMGRLLAEWDHRDAGALFLLPLWNPVLAAEQIATLACIAEGKFIMQCGLGNGNKQFTAMGTNIKYRPSAFEQSLACMRALWAGDTVSLNGRWTFTGAKISPLPPEDIEVWIGASAPVAIERAARLGDAWLADPSMLLPQAKTAMAHYQQALLKYDKELPATIAIRRDIYIAESDQDGQQVRTLIEEKGYRGFDSQALIIGTAEQVAEQFQQFYSLGYTDIIVRNLHTNADKAVASTQRIADVKALLG